MADGTCSCGCGTMQIVTQAHEPCTCSCECCSEPPKSPEEEVSELRRLLAAVQRRLEELESAR